MVGGENQLPQVFISPPYAWHGEGGGGEGERDRERRENTCKNNVLNIPVSFLFCENDKRGRPKISFMLWNWDVFCFLFV